MKIGFNLLLWNSHVTPDHAPVLAQLKAAGYDGVEIPIFEGTPDHYAALKRELDNTGLACTTITVATPDANPISPDAAVRQAAVERMKWLVECSHALDSTILAGPYHSALGQFSGQGPTDDEKQWAVEVLWQCAEIAAPAGLTLAIEYLNRFECYFLTTAAATRELVSAVNHPNFRAMYDTFHANIEEKHAAPAIETLADVLVHVHVSENDRGTPGSGHVAWDETFRALKAVGYDGWLTIEAFGRALPALAAATKVWRDLFPSNEEVYQTGLRFIRDHWAR